MNTFRKNLLTAVAALSLGSAAFAVQAQDATPQAPAQQGAHAGHRQMPTPEQRAAFRAQRIAKLHDELKITPAQESAWNSFVASMQPPAPAVQNRTHDRSADRAAWANMTAPERMAKMIDLQKKRTAALEQRQGALSSFYSVLSPDQKKTFDERANRLQGHFGKHGGAHGGMHGDWQQRGGTARG
jgi:protein CpxP